MKGSWLSVQGEDVLPCFLETGTDGQSLGCVESITQRQEGSVERLAQARRLQRARVFTSLTCRFCLETSF